jgi:antirestriction protein
MDGLEPKDPEACRVDDGTIEEKSADDWVVTIFYARKNRYLGTFATKEGATEFLAAVKQILESFGKTQDEVNAMTDSKARAAIERARYEAEASSGIYSKENAPDTKDARMATDTAKPKESDVDALQKIVEASLKSLDESDKNISKRKTGKRLRDSIEYYTDCGNLRGLHQARCNTCVLCCKNDCKRCEPCIRNRECENESQKEVCLRKVGSQSPLFYMISQGLKRRPGSSLLVYISDAVVLVCVDVLCN